MHCGLNVDPLSETLTSNVADPSLRGNDASLPPNIIRHVSIPVGSLHPSLFAPPLSLSLSLSQPSCFHPSARPSISVSSCRFITFNRQIEVGRKKTSASRETRPETKASHHAHLPASAAPVPALLHHQSFARRLHSKMPTPRGGQKEETGGYW